MEQLVTIDDLKKENDLLRQQLEEANLTIEAIRTGQVDALVIHGKEGHELYKLKTADQTYRVLIEKMSEGAVTLNEEGIILYSNSKFASMVGIPLSKVIGVPFDRFICSNDSERYYNLFNASWTEECKGEIVLQCDNKRIYYCQMSLTTLELDEGISLSIILTDIGAQKETQEKLKSNNDKLAQINHDLEISNYDLQQFAYVASHDLQEPLRKIHIYSDRIKSKYIPAIPTEIPAYLEKIISATRRMQILISDILSYSRLSEHNTEFRTVDLNPIVQEILVDLEIVIEEKKAILAVGDLPTIEANPGQIRQVFQNLISNALKFCKKGEPPYITITSASHTDYYNSIEAPGYSISVADNGIGFEDEYAKNIFLLFQRLHSKNKYEGTGIGLAIAKKIIDKHNGQIIARSQPGVGSEFTFRLPTRQI